MAAAGTTRESGDTWSRAPFAPEGGVGSVLVVLVQPVRRRRSGIFAHLPVGLVGEPVGVGLETPEAVSVVGPVGRPLVPATSATAC